jgi:tetratricopeptide (TPR) repeat protein
MKKLGKVGLVLGVLTLTGTVACSGKEDPAKEHRAKATNHYNKKEFKLAIQEYDLALAADPTQAKSWREKAQAHELVGEYDKAAESLLKYVELEKNPPEKLEDLYGKLAEWFGKAGQPAEAEKALLKIMETRPTPEAKAELYRTIADMYRVAGNLDAAEARFNEALKLNPKDEASLGWLAAIYSLRGGTQSATAPAVPEHLEKAISYLDQVIALNPDYPFTYINKRIVMAKYMQYEQQQQQAAEAEARTIKNKAKSAEKMAEAAEHLKKAQDYQKQFEELTQKFSEAQKKAKEKKAAAAAAAEGGQPGQAPAPTPAPGK